VARRVSLTGVGIALAILCAAVVATAAPHHPGKSDLGFGEDKLGIAAIPASSFTDGLDNFGGMAIDGGGRIVLAGDTNAPGEDDFAAGRLRPNGRLDTSFGNPVTHVSVGNIDGDEDVAAAAAGPNGTTYIGADSYSGGVDRFGVARIDSSGFFDSGFDVDGRTTTTIGTDAAPTAIAVQRNGKVLVAGRGGPSGGGAVALVRYLQDGLPDPGFGGGDGIVTTPVGTISSAFDVEVARSGKITVAGAGSFGPANREQGIVTRYRPNGTLDPSFGKNGIVRLRVTPKSTVIFALELGSKGKVLLGGVTNAKVTGFVARLDAAGKRDHGFGGGDGILRSNFRQPGIAYVTDLALQRNGKIVIAGFGGDIPGVVGGTLVARLRPNGTLDRGFASRGARLFLLGATGFAMTKVAVLPSGRIILAGKFQVGGESVGFFAAKLYGDPVRHKR
jgi:uncharacterized delta-60 repeat protein